MFPRQQNEELVEDWLDINVIFQQEERTTRAILKEIRDDIVSWIKDTEESIKCLGELAEEMEDLFRKTSKIKKGGSAAAITGGILSVVGFGLSFVTFGTSLILAIAGGVVAGAGGVTTGAASVVNFVKTSTKTKAAEDAVKGYNEQLHKIKRTYIELTLVIRDIHEMPEWVGFWRKLTQAHGAHFARGDQGIVVLPIDLHALISSALKVGKGYAEVIRKLAYKMKEGCPTVKEVDAMIGRTMNRL